MTVTNVGPDITSVLNELCARQLAVSISSPVPASIKAAYPVSPGRGVLIEPPCFVNDFSLTGHDHTFDADLMHYTITSQLYLPNADLGQAALMATAFGTAYFRAIDNDFTFGGMLVNAEMRGRIPTLVMLDRDGQSYPGLELYLDVEFDVVAVVS